MSLPVRLGSLLALTLTLVATSDVADAKPEKPGAAAIAGNKGAKSDKGAKDKSNKSEKGDKGAKGVKAKKAADKGDSPSKRPQSIGAPNSGRLSGAALLKQSKQLKQRAGAHSWGLPALVKLLHRAADRVAKKHRGSTLLVGDLSGKTGGHLDGHNSHQTGRDADIGFYVMNSRGKPVATKRFIAFDEHGRARDLPWASFDDARNWALVQALLEDPQANVRYLFVTNALRARLLAHAAKKNASKELIAKAAAAMMSPKDADVHDDHFHVRIACPESMRGVCVEESSARGDAIAKDDHEDKEKNDAQPADGDDAAKPPAIEVPKANEGAKPPVIELPKANGAAGGHAAAAKQQGAGAN